jgi:hypothetical protein
MKRIKARKATAWTQTSLKLASITAMTQNQMLRREPLGNWSYGYFSLIDPKSADSSFMTITDNPCLYYVRMDGDHPPYQRVLFRQKIKLDWLAPLHPKPNAPPGTKQPPR